MDIFSLSLYGARKTGKTTFALTAPKPLVVFDLESGVEEIEWRYVDNKEQVMVVPLAEPLLGVPKRSRPETAKTIYQDFLKQYNKYLEDKTTQTIVLDTWTAIWELCRNAYLQELGEESGNKRSQLLQIEYGEPNRRMKNILVQGRLHKKLVIVTQHARQKYIINPKGESVPGDELEPDGFKYTGDLADVVLYFTKDKRGDPPKTMPVAIIEDCRLTMAAEGVELPMPNYATLFNLLKSLRGE